MSDYIDTTCARRSVAHDQTGTDLAHTTLASVAGFSTACGVLLVAESWMLALLAWFLTVIATFALLTLIVGLQRAQALIARGNTNPPRSYNKNSGTQKHV